MRAASLAMVLSVAFLLFATIGLLTVTIIPKHEPLPLFWGVVCMYGLFAAAYAFVSIRIHWALIFPIMPLEFLASWYLIGHIALQPTLPTVAHSELIRRIDWSSGLACVMIIAGYTLAFAVMGREGKRFFKVHAEVELASEIHRALVPRIDLRVGEFEIYGLSVPSGEVGGDLVDAFVRPQGGGWIAYVADVSGHGVSSGVLMAMLKSATRMSLRQNSDARRMLGEVNEVFYSLKSPNSFATCAAINFTEQRGVEVIVAGHLPILYSDGSTVRELDTPGLPIGIEPEADFHAMPLDLRTGDLLAIVTDGLTEVFNKKGAELEGNYIKRTLLAEFAQPLDKIASGLLSRADAWGARSDDQSLLLVRRVG